MSDCPQPKKVNYSTRESAWRQIDDIARAEKRRDKWLRPYPCGDHWHIGHRPGSGRGGLEGKIRRSLRSGR